MNLRCKHVWRARKISLRRGKRDFSIFPAERSAFDRAVGSSPCTQRGQPAIQQQSIPALRHDSSSNAASLMLHRRAASDYEGKPGRVGKIGRQFVPSVTAHSQLVRYRSV
jgi:hypothetical protein